MKKVFIAFALMLTVIAGGGQLYKSNVKPVAKVSVQKAVAETDPWGIAPKPTITPNDETDPWG